MSETHAIVVEKVVPYAPDKVWRILTTSELIAKWLMPNDFVAAVGHRFTFHTKPIGDWDGVVYCEVLTCEPPRLLSYSWKGGAEANPLDSVLTWTLTPVDGGTHLRMVHDGFVFPGNKFAFEMMGKGWGRIGDAIARMAADA
jgi:uncharacterized protein YndB with AHSA1/START domain